jgi:MoxR-like ATPase
MVVPRAIHRSRLPCPPESSRAENNASVSAVVVGAFPYDSRVAFGSVEQVEAALRQHDYLPDRGLATAIHLALAMGRPLLLEGEAGVGKTEVGKTLARILDAELIRLQCYEGIDAGQALYEWDYSRQLLYARTLQAGELDAELRVRELYGPDFLVERPLLRAIRAGRKAVLLVDELDRADDEFEAFLLEVLSDYAVTIPELGTIAAEEPPAVVITSNRTRELHDALKRRCLYHWIEFPDLEREVEIIRVRAPGVSEQLARSVAAAVARLRELDLVKRPGAAEAIDWARALSVLGAESADGDGARETLGWVVKNREDLGRAEAGLAELLRD